MPQPSKAANKMKPPLVTAIAQKFTPPSQLHIHVDQYRFQAFRSFNRRPDSLERNPGSFHANDLESLLPSADSTLC